MTDATLNADVVIIGAGPVGMALAGALRGNQRVLLIDRRPRGAWASDPRVLAVAHGSRQLLERLKAWDSGSATPIRDIHVSQRGGFGRTRIRPTITACRRWVTSCVIAILPLRST